MKARRQARKFKLTTKQFEALTPKNLAKYEDSLEVLSLMRKGHSINEASEQVGVSSSVVKKYVGSALELKNRRWVPKPSDRLLRKVRIYENGKEVYIAIRGNRKAATIAQYHSAIGRFAKDAMALKQFKKVKLRDSKGKTHRLETDVNRILAILERREDAEFYTIYAR